MKKWSRPENRGWMAVIVFCLFCASLSLCGCHVEEAKEEKIQDMEIVLVEEEEIPEELAIKIEEKKAADMKLVFESGESTYIVRGYGEQETGGYSIQILEFYETKNAVVLSTNLLGPPKGSTENVSPSFPYVVLKTETLDKTLIFE